MKCDLDCTFSHVLNVYNCATLRFHRVCLEGRSDTEIHVLAQVASRSLQLLSLEDEKPINHVSFGPTFYGTDVLRSYVLFNKSPEAVSFVVILEEDGEGQEMVS